MISFSLSLLIGLNRIICELDGKESVIINKSNLESALSPFSLAYDNLYVTYAKVFRNLIIAHGFQDGNKRTACLALITANRPTCSDKELADIALEIARDSRYTKDIEDLPERLYGSKALQEDATQCSNIGGHKVDSIDMFPEVEEKKEDKDDLG